MRRRARSTGSPSRFPAGARSPRCAPRSRSFAAAAGSSRSSPTPTTTSSPRRRCRSASSFDEVVVAQEIGSYKPAHRHWEEFFQPHARAARRSRARRRVALPRHRAGERARPRRASGSTGSARRAATAPARRASCRICSSCRRRSMSSSLLRELREEDAEQVAALFVDGVRRGAEARRARGRVLAARPRPRATRTCALSRKTVASSAYGDVAPRGDVLFVDLAAPGSLGRVARLGRRSRSPSLGLKTASLFVAARARARATSPKPAATRSAASR